MSHNISRRGGRSASTSGAHSSSGNDGRTSAHGSSHHGDEDIQHHLSDTEIEGLENLGEGTESAGGVSPSQVPVLPSDGVRRKPKLRIIAADPKNHGMFQPQAVSTILSTIIKNRWDGAWMRWDDIPNPVKDAMWEDFNNKCDWDDDIEVDVKNTFRSKGKASMTNWFNKARKNGKAPGWMNDDIWDELMEKWATDATFKKFSDRGKKNQASNCGGKGAAIHTQGRTSISTLRQNMKIASGVEPTRSEVFAKAHMKKGTKEYVNDRAARTIANFEIALEERKRKAMEEAAASNSQPIPVDPDVVWIEVVGERYGRVYGMGHEADIARMKKITSQTQSSSSVAPLASAHRISSQEQDDLRYRVQELSTQFNAMEKAISERLDSTLSDRLETVVAEKVQSTLSNEFMNFQKTMMSTMMSFMEKTIDHRKSKKSKKKKKRKMDEPLSSEGEE